jgi:hypothetical protein
MGFKQSKNRTKYFGVNWNGCLVVVLSVVLLLVFGSVGLAVGNEDTDHYKMISVLEYTGKGQFRSQVETLFTVRKRLVSDDKVQYFISANDFDLAEDNMKSGQQSSHSELSFVIDRTTGYLSEASSEWEFFEKVSNECVKAVKQVTKQNVGKTWKQSFDLSFLEHLFAGQLKFTLTAIPLETEAFGEMVAVRALSEPFVVKAAKKGGGTGPVRSRINAAYLFDPEVEDIYISISVFEATTNVNGFKEELRHEMATYKTDPAGVAVDLSGLGKKFEKLARKVGLSTKSVKVVKESSLPQWVQYRGLAAIQVTNLCAGTACESALNPVATVCMPAARTVALQGAGKLTAAKQIATISSLLVKNIPGLGGMKIATAPAFMGMGLGTTTGAVAGGTAGAIAIAGGGGGGDDDEEAATPTTP